MVWLSEGVGGAVVIGRRLLRGATGGGGEIDWMRVPDAATVDTGDVWPEAGARFGNLVDSPAICRLAAAHGITAETAWDAVIQAGEKHSFLDDLARRVAGGIANLVAVADPQLVLLCGDTSRAGGENFAALVQGRLHQLVLPRTPVGCASVQGNAVRAGALQSALAKTREDVFGVVTPTLLGSRRPAVGPSPGKAAVPNTRPAPSPTELPNR
jgi:predicted NBD/HSP70 family sugar kinase